MIETVKRVGLLGLPFLAFSFVQAQDLPEGKGKELVEQFCVGCHDLDVVMKQRATRKGWASILDFMGTRGMAGTPDEVAIMVDYLAKNFPKEAVKINLNKATAKEIETDLELSPKEAEAIVKYRQDHGDFKE